MGSAASITNSTMNEEEVKAICGEKFDYFFFNALKNDENLIFTTDLNRLLTSSTELEVCRLFLTYSPKNNMNEQTYLTLLRDAKLLNKGLFSIKDAEKLFFKIKTEHEPPLSRGISYKTWRHHVLVEISSLKGIELDKLLTKLAHCEDLIEAIAQKREDQKVIERASSDAKTTTTTQSPRPNHPAPLGIKNVFTDAQHDACIKIQTAQRTKSAIIAAQRKKEINNVAKTTDPFPLPTIEAGEPSEIALVQLFHSYTPIGEMSKKMFVTLLKDAKLYDKELTMYDAEFIFDRVKAKCIAPSSPFQDQVVHNKRLKYQPFRLLIIPDTAEMKNQSVDKFIQVLVNAIPLSPMNEDSVNNSPNPNNNNNNNNNNTKKR